MNLRANPSSGKRGFTMVEIAICLGVIAFALLAIIHVLPFAMNTQRDNRFETIVNMDAAYWLSAIRGGGLTNGGPGVSEITNYVDHITTPNNGGKYTLANKGFTTGREVIGLLSTPAWQKAGSTNFEPGAVAVVRALSGPMADQDPSLGDFAFRYRLTVTVPTENLHAADLSTSEGRMLNKSLREMTLEFAWPVRADGTVGRSYKMYRSTFSVPPFWDAAGIMITQPIRESAAQPYYFFHYE